MSEANEASPAGCHSQNRAVVHWVAVHAENQEAGKEQQFFSLEAFLHRESNDGYEQVAKEMNVSAGSLRMSELRMRRRYRALLRAEIGQTESTPEEIDGEITFLQSKLSR